MADTTPALTAPSRDIDLVETAKLMRRRLAVVFPGIKFSVRTSRFAGGSSADVSWTDGPTTSQVRTEVDCFGYGGFDGMTDSSYSYGAWLCTEHGAGFRHHTATGSMDAADGGPCCLGAEPVRFGAKWIGQRRDLTPEFEQMIKDDIESVTGEEFAHNRRYDAVVLPSSPGYGADSGKLVPCTGSPQYGSDLFGRLAGNTAITAEGEVLYLPAAAR